MYLTLFTELINYYQSVMIKLIKHRIDMNKTRAEDDNIIVCQPFIEANVMALFRKIADIILPFLLQLIQELGLSFPIYLYNSPANAILKREGT
jgi:hypothetical protein